MGDEIEVRKKKAQRGWIAEPPAQGEPTPPSHIGKWRKMMDARNLLREMGSGGEIDV